MDKAKKTFSFVVIAIIAIITTITFYFRGKKNKSKNITGNFPLMENSTGEVVKDIQKRLNEIFPGINLEVDGILGANTKKYVSMAVGFPVTSELYEQLKRMAPGENINTENSNTRTVRNIEPVYTDDTGKRWIIVGVWKGGTWGCPAGQSKIYVDGKWVCAIRSNEKA